MITPWTWPLEHHGYNNHMVHFIVSGCKFCLCACDTKTNTYFEAFIKKMAAPRLSRGQKSLLIIPTYNWQTWGKSNGALGSEPNNEKTLLLCSRMTHSHNFPLHQQPLSRWMNYTLIPLIPPHFTADGHGCHFCFTSCHRLVIPLCK